MVTYYPIQRVSTRMLCVLFSVPSARGSHTKPCHVECVGIGFDARMLHSQTTRRPSCSVICWLSARNACPRVNILTSLALGHCRPYEAGLRSHDQKTQCVNGLLAGPVTYLWLRSDIYLARYQAPPTSQFGLPGITQHIYFPTSLHVLRHWTPRQAGIRSHNLKTQDFAVLLAVLHFLGHLPPRQAGLGSHNQKTQGIAGLLAGLLIYLWQR